MLHARDGEQLYLHGSSASRLIRASGESEICVTATLVDGLVLARSVFHHSVNYRSAVVFGRPERIEDEDGKLAALEAFTEKMIPGRWADARTPTSQELKGTGVLRMTIDEASAKVRTGGRGRRARGLRAADLGAERPLRTVAGEPIPDDRLLEGVEEPGYVAEYRDAHS